LQGVSNGLDRQVLVGGDWNIRKTMGKPWENHGKPWENCDLYGTSPFFTEYSKSTTGWWFGTMEFYDFPYIGNNDPN